MDRLLTDWVAKNDNVFLHTDYYDSAAWVAVFKIDEIIYHAYLQDANGNLINESAKLTRHAFPKVYMPMRLQLATIYLINSNYVQFCKYVRYYMCSNRIIKSQNGKNGETTVLKKSLLVNRNYCSITIVYIQY